MSILIEVKELKKHFKTVSGLLHAVDGVSFHIQEGETLGVVGESGCGKSTLGRMLIGLIDATSGQIFYDGSDITHASNDDRRMLRKEMQIIFQDPFSSLDPRMTVSETISEPLIIYKQYHTKNELNSRVSEIMNTVGLSERLKDSYPHELDGGRRQRIGIGRALALKPKFIVCDEPVSALDVSIQAQILNLMQDLQDQHGLTYLFITHDLSVVKHVSTNILVMYLGCMVELSSSKLLFKHQYHPYTKGLISSIPVPDIHLAHDPILMKGELTSPINPQPGCRFASRCPYAKSICFSEDPDFREVEKDHYVACHFVEEINDLHP